MVDSFPTSAWKRDARRVLMKNKFSSYQTEPPVILGSDPPTPSNTSSVITTSSSQSARLMTLKTVLKHSWYWEVRVVKLSGKWHKRWNHQNLLNSPSFITDLLNQLQRSELLLSMRWSTLFLSWNLMNSAKLIQLCLLWVRSLIKLFLFNSSY